MTGLQTNLGTRVDILREILGRFLEVKDDVGSAFEAEVHREMVENLTALQSGQSVEAGNATLFRRNGTWRVDDASKG